MSLSTLFAMLKGGSGSGNFGHTGNPPARGGSKGGSGGIGGLRRVANEAGLKIVAIPENQQGPQGYKYAIRDLKKQGGMGGTNMRAHDLKGVRDMIDSHKKFRKEADTDLEKAKVEAKAAVDKTKKAKNEVVGPAPKDAIPTDQVSYIMGRSKAQIQKDVNILAKKPLKELRRNQDIISQQMDLAYQQKKPEKTMLALQRMYDDQTEAIMKREFPND
jgi:hypothetical protein